jgi:hypothetical protein
MNKTATFIFVLLAIGTIFAQGPVPIVTPVFIDSAVYNAVYRGHQNQFFCELNTGNLVTSWYRYYSSGPNPRRITAATSIDGGQTWTIHEEINLGVGDEMNARYPSVSGTQTTPIVVYSDRNPSGANQNSRPVVAKDILGWGGGLFDNTFVDNSGSVDTVLCGRYLSVKVAPDNDNFWAIGTYHHPDYAPGESYYYYYSDDAGINWSRPRVVASAVAADSQAANYSPDISSSGLGIGLGNNNTVFASFLIKPDSTGDIWRMSYATSTDKGNTWSPTAPIPGGESLSFLNSNIYRQFTEPILDNAGNWHIFAIGVDTSESHGVSFPEPYRGWDFRYDGSTWTVNKFVYPQLLDNGIVALGDYEDQEENAMNEPAIGPDGTLYYAYVDVVDTTGAGGDAYEFNYNIMVMYSENNGDSWNGPVSVLDQYRGLEPNGLARNATDKLHFVYRKDNLSPIKDEFFYMGVPTDTIKQIATSIGSEIEKLIPNQFSLHQNYPNPFNPTTSIRFDLKTNTHVTLIIYNALGQEITKLVDIEMTAGFKGVVWDASNMTSGTYFYTIKAGDFSETKKMILLK